MKHSQNIEWVETIAQALGDELRQKMIFTGGAVVELYYQNTRPLEPRITKDVDAIVTATTRSAYYDIEEQLRRRGFENAGLRGQKGPTCRFLYRDIVFDVMPTEEKVLGLSNRWFPDAVQNPFQHTLPSGTVINLATFPRFLAIKLETLLDRGGADIRGSHDLEDIVRLVYGRNDPLSEMKRESKKISEFVRDTLQNLFTKQNLAEAIDAASVLKQEQVERVLRVFEALTKDLKRISGLER